ncbi:Sec7 domain protein [Mycena indigotica]|uniref:Sec7 domain protein n=1 Tax=Mycena indigotica TaxID=2126181 RepID=A0A8H6SWZ9_9AGAR|nr:Sec7 domain protein [Mycena indigotica]KAF7306675.1 Sec7 domain protein [Mycena indigotica]
MAEKKILHTARKLSKVFKETPYTIEAKTLLSPTSETATASNASASASSLAVGSISGVSISTGTEETSSNANSTEQLRRKASKLTRESAENIPPPPSQRQSMDSAALTTPRPHLRRSRSMWVRQQQQQQQQQQGENEAANDFQDRYLRNFGTMSERQRVLNVKRARKMTQLFGQEPPAELIQILDDRENVDPSRDSVALSTLMTSTPLRDRANSVSSLADGVGAAATTPSAVAPEAEESDVNIFQDRRRRAAKLSRFFGVGFQDITSLPDVLPVPVVSNTQVDVKVAGRRFWSFGDRPRDSDMREAISQLRGLKAG